MADPDKFAEELSVHIDDQVARVRDRLLGLPDAGSLSWGPLHNVPVRQVVMDHRREAIDVSTMGGPEASILEGEIIETTLVVLIPGDFYDLLADAAGCLDRLVFRDYPGSVYTGDAVLVKWSMDVARISGEMEALFVSAGLLSVRHTEG